MDVYTNQPLVLEEDSLWNQDEPNNYGGEEDCIAVAFRHQRSGLEDQSCLTSQTCVLCSLERHPQLQLRELRTFSSPQIIISRPSFFASLGLVNSRNGPRGG